VLTLDRRPGLQLLVTTAWRESSKRAQIQSSECVEQKHHYEVAVCVYIGQNVRIAPNPHAHLPFPNQMVSQDMA
jgi:hypothetical protein